METRAPELNSPPPYNPRAKEEMEFLNNPGQQIQSTVVTIIPEEPPVRDHLIWSIFSTVYLNFCCLGLIALVFSVKSRDRKHVGDRNGATSYASTARSLNIAATTLTILFSIIMIIVYIVNMVALYKLVQDDMESINNRYGK